MIDGRFGNQVTIVRRSVLNQRSVSCGLLLAAMFLVVGCRTRLAPGVTCEGIRSLKLGMSEEEVAQLLGPPVNGGPIMLPADKDTPVVWNYSDEPGLFGGVELRVEFVDAKLDDAMATAIRLRNSAIATVFNSKETYLFLLDKRLGRIEESAFVEFLGCP